VQVSVGLAWLGLAWLGLAWLGLQNAELTQPQPQLSAQGLGCTHQRVRSWCKTLCSAWSALKPDGPGSGAPPWLFAGTSCERRSDAAIYRCALIAPFCPDGYCAALRCAALRIVAARSTGTPAQFRRGNAVERLSAQVGGSNCRALVTCWSALGSAADARVGDAVGESCTDAICESHQPSKSIESKRQISAKGPRGS
jgi:hypothetical protein